MEQLGFELVESLLGGFLFTATDWAIDGLEHGGLAVCAELCLDCVPSKCEMKGRDLLEVAVERHCDPGVDD